MIDTQPACLLPRMGRREWLIFVFSSAFFSLFLTGSSFIYLKENQVVRWVMEDVGFFASLAVFLPLFFVFTVRRSRDIGWHDWTAWIAIFPGAMLIWLVMPGSGSKNRYGSPSNDIPWPRFLRIIGSLIILLTMSVNFWEVGSEISDPIESSLRVNLLSP